MLVCGRPHDDCLHVDSIINDISITLPDRKFTIPSAHIDQGRIVRTFQCMDDLPRHHLHQKCYDGTVLAERPPAIKRILKIVPAQQIH